MIRTTLVAALALGSLASPVQAQPTEIAIKVSDAELESSEGRSRLRRQVASAIEQICGSYAATESFQWQGIDECRRKAWETTTRQIAALRKGDTVKVSTR